MLKCYCLNCDNTLSLSPSTYLDGYLKETCGCGFITTFAGSVTDCFSYYSDIKYDLISFVERDGTATSIYTCCLGDKEYKFPIGEMMEGYFEWKAFRDRLKQLSNFE